MNIIKQPKMISDIFQSNFNNMLQDILIDQNIIESKIPKFNFKDTVEISNFILDNIYKDEKK